MRKRDDQERLWQALGDGEIQTICTDHCSSSFAGQKELGRGDFSKISNGMPSIEHRPAVIYHGWRDSGLHHRETAALLAENSARLFGVYPRKGALLVGSGADIVVWDPDYCGAITAAAMNINVDYTPYEGMLTVGRPHAVFLCGELVARDGEVVEEQRGAYVARRESEYF